MAFRRGYNRFSKPRHQHNELSQPPKVHQNYTSTSTHKQLRNSNLVAEERQLPETLYEMMQYLQDPSIGFEDTAHLLSFIEDKTHKIEYATQFCELGGFNILKRFVQMKSNSACRGFCGSIMGNVVQQNRVCQQKALDENLMDLMFQLLADKDVEVQRKGAFALSGLLRSCPAAQTRFCEQYGLEKLRDAAKFCNGDERVETKLWFLLSALASESTDMAGLLVKQEFYKDALEIFKRYSRHDSHEHVLAMMIAITKPNFINAIPIAHKADFYSCLRNKLSKTNESGKWQNEVTLQYANELSYVLLYDEEKRYSGEESPIIVTPQITNSMKDLLDIKTQPECARKAGLLAADTQALHTTKRVPSLMDGFVPTTSISAHESKDLSKSDLPPANHPSTDILAGENACEGITNGEQDVQGANYLALEHNQLTRGLADGFGCSTNGAYENTLRHATKSPMQGNHIAPTFVGGRSVQEPRRAYEYRANTTRSLSPSKPSLIRAVERSTGKTNQMTVRSTEM